MKEHKPQEYKRKPLEDAEQDKLVNACTTHKEKLIVYTLLDTGLRVSEFSKLKPEDVKWQHNVMEVYGKGGRFGKYSKRRNAPLSPRVKEILSKQFAISNEIGMSPRTIQREIKKLGDKAGIVKDLTPHVLRHTFSVNAIRKGVNLRAIQEALGHEHITTTEIYLRYSGKNVADDFKRMWG